MPEQRRPGTAARSPACPCTRPASRFWSVSPGVNSRSRVSPEVVSVMLGSDDPGPARGGHRELVPQVAPPVAAAVLDRVGEMQVPAGHLGGQFHRQARQRRDRRGPFGGEPPDVLQVRSLEEEPHPVAAEGQVQAQVQERRLAGQRMPQARVRLDLVQLRPGVLRPLPVLPLQRRASPRPVAPGAPASASAKVAPLRHFWKTPIIATRSPSRPPCPSFPHRVSFSSLQGAGARSATAARP